MDVLQESRAFLLDLVERRGFPVFRDLQQALDVVRILVENPRLTVRDLADVEDEEPVRESRFNISEIMSLLLHVFQSYDNRNCGRISFHEVSMALRHVCTYTTALSHAADHHAAAEMSYSFADFCILYVEEMAQRYGWTGGLTEWWHTFCGLPLLLWHWLCPPCQGQPRYGVFLGGRCGGQRSWRQVIAEPLLRKCGVTYLNPQSWNVYLGTEDKAREQCSVLLYVITADSWSSCCLVEAAHFIGLGRRVVLHVDMLKSNDSRFSVPAIKDYNRGRQYILDLAYRAGVPVLSTARQAVIRAAQMCKLDMCY